MTAAVVGVPIRFSRMLALERAWSMLPSAMVFAVWWSGCFALVFSRVSMGRRRAPDGLLDRTGHGIRLAGRTKGKSALQRLWRWGAGHCLRSERTELRVAVGSGDRYGCPVFLRHSSNSIWLRRNS